jgi:hypothetical protein
MTCVGTQTAVPNWDLEQLEVILEPASCWQLVIAGPGAGKSAVACQRVAFLMDDGVTASKILLISFTRTAVAELRDRITSYAVASSGVRSVRISTLDSHAWSLRTGFDESHFLTAKSGETNSYELSIRRALDMFREKQPDLLDFMNRLEHLIVDEAQDILGDRAELVVEVLRSLSPSCGVTVLADPAQAIYGFTTDGNVSGPSPSGSLLDLLRSVFPDRFKEKTLRNIHRINGNPALAEVFLRTRKAIEGVEDTKDHVNKVQQAIRKSCGQDAGLVEYNNFADFLTRVQDSSMLVLFRHRADVLFASSYCSDAGIEHRLRLSGLPTIVKPWLGWLLGEETTAVITRQGLEKLWNIRSEVCPQPFAGEGRDDAWSLLHRLAAGKRQDTIDLVHLRTIVSRSRPPLELCFPEMGNGGPILGTIHASKGREADTVVLVFPPPQQPQEDTTTTEGERAAIFEEGRVYYVGATRARKMLTAIGGSKVRVGYLESGRIFRTVGQQRAQLEIGRADDVDRVAHLSWATSTEIQATLASCVGTSFPTDAISSSENNYAPRLVVARKGEDNVTRHTEVGQLSESFKIDLGKLWGKVDRFSRLKPAPAIRHLHMIGVSTVCLTEMERSRARVPYSQSAFALVPVVKGFPTIEFFARSRRTT